MIRIRPLTGAAFLLLVAGSAAAQDAGGIGFAPGGIPAANLAQAFAQPARMPVFVNGARRGAPPGAMVTNPTVSRTSVNQRSIARIRGDAGFLGGFDKGQALAPSRQAPLPAFEPSITFIEAPFIVNNFNSALNFAFGEGNVTEQQVVQSPGEGGAAPAGASHPAGAQHPSDAASSSTLPAVPAAASGDPAAAATGAAADALLTTAGPLPHLPLALERGGVRFNNVNSSINVAAGTGNFAGQSVLLDQR